MSTRMRSSSKAPAKGSPQLKIAEMFRRKRRDIVVPKGRSIEVSPASEFSDHFLDVEIESFDDLRKLHLVAPNLDGKRVREAIRSDDARALELARQQAGSNFDACTCEGAPGSSAASPYHARLRAAYGGIRKRQHQDLAAILSEIYRKTVDWDSPEAVSTWSWIEKLSLAGRISIKVLFAADIIVGHNATMMIAAATKHRTANNIKIHTGGRIVVAGSYIKVLCNSAVGNLA